MISFTTDLNRIDWNEAAEVIRQAPLGTREPAKMRQAFFNSFVSVFAFDGNRLVGMARALCDGEYQAAIYDVVVLPDYQKKEVGKRMVQQICDRLPVQNIILFAAPGKENFYKKLGFRIMLTGMAKFEPRLADPQRGYLKSE